MQKILTILIFTITVDKETLTEEEQTQILIGNMKRFKDAANLARPELIARYGKKAARSIKYAEIFEQSPYGATVSKEEFQALFD